MMTDALVLLPAGALVPPLASALVLLRAPYQHLPLDPTYLLLIFYERAHDMALHPHARERIKHGP